MKTIIAKILIRLRNNLGRERIVTRSFSAHCLMVLFVMLSAIGAGLLLPPLGLIVAGVNCGLYGYLMGSD
jgi:hypothetical protein